MTDLTPATYQRLISDLSQILDEGRRQAVIAVNETILKTYWEMGKRLNEEKDLVDSANAGTFMNKLADDLNLEVSLLYRILQFYRTWPEAIPTVENENTLSWAHYVEVLSIKDPKERDFYLESAASQDWGRNTLRKAIQKDLFSASQTPKKFKAAQALERDPSPLYTYKVIVEKVVDGDTLLVLIDLGFNVWVEQRIRFRGINTAELVKDGIPSGEAPGRGEQAKQFVEEKLKDIEFIVIKTYKTDMYGRFVADVFYHPTIKKKEEIAEKGFFFNAQLLEAELADPMM